jgi:adenylate cyclase
MKKLRVLRVYDNGKPIWEAELVEPIEFGRLETVGVTKLPVVQRGDQNRPLRVLIAQIQENYVSRHHLLLKPVGDDSVEVTNLSQTNPIYFSRGEMLPRADHNQSPSRVIQLSADSLLITMRGDLGSNKTISLELNQDVESMSWVTSSALGQPSGPRQFMSIADLAKRDDHESLKEWLNTLIGVLQSAANSNDFYMKAAEAVVRLVGMDFASVLLWENGDWQPKASVGEGSSLRVPSRLALARAQHEKQTIFRTAPPGSNAMTMDARVSDSLASLEAVVAAPFFDENHDVLGIVYGSRTRMLGALQPNISRIDATLVTALAHGVEVGLRRVRSEKSLIEAQVRFEQFFSPELARELATNDGMLKGADRDVSILFCDIRSFSRISERLGAEATLEVVGEFFNIAAAEVMKHKGVVVDYIGDELIAMWGAPKEQPHHAELACRAGLGILEAIKQHDAYWEQKTGSKLRAGIGINSGIARVGNIGSQQRFKYGPLGSMVNLASRVQGATKYFKTEMLITDATRQQLGSEFHSRRIRKVRVVNIETPIDLHEVWLGEDSEREQAAKTYEAALASLEKGEFRDASRAVAELIRQVEPEGPALVLAAQALQFATNPDLTFTPEWTLPGK